MNYKRNTLKSLGLIIFFIIAIPFCMDAQTISVHDPVMIRQDSTYYIFCTGMGISVWSSTDMKNWKKEQPVFEKAPDWALKAVPLFKGHIWGT
jgi:arabinan endo-1,5-alpha-L-arabinosidase